MKNKLNINRQPLTKADIEQSKNFDALLKSYKKVTKPFYRTNLFYSMSGIAASIMILLFVWYYHSMPTAQQLASHPFIDPALTGVKIEFASYSVPADTGGTYTYKTGSKIVVPAGAFLTKNGSVAKGKVTLTYREFHDHADIMLSGIPMAYDSGKQLVSAGMMEIEATQNGELLEVNPNARINVEMAASDSGNKYNTYYLDTVTKKWVYISKSQVIKTCVNENTNAGSIASNLPMNTLKQYGDTEAINPYQQKFAELQGAIQLDNQVIIQPLPVKPMEPKKAMPQMRRFDIEVDSIQFPEVAVYKKVEFQLTDDEKNYDSKLSNITWTDVKVTKDDSSDGIYLVTFSRGDESHTFKTIPVFEGKYYTEAKQKFDELDKQYTQKVQNKKRAQERADSLRKVQIALNEQIRKQDSLNRVANLKQMQEDAINAQRNRIKITYTNNNNIGVKSTDWHDQLGFAEGAKDFDSSATDILQAISVDHFGVWNTDYPYETPAGRMIRASFSNSGNTQVTFVKIYLVEKDINTASRIYSEGNQGIVFSYDPKSDNIIWGITADGRIGVVSAEEFEAKTKNPGLVVTFKVVLSGKKFDNASDVKAFINANSFNADDVSLK